MNAALKRAAELVLLHGGAARLARLGVSGRTLVLAYHNIVPNGERPVGETALHLPQRRFAAQLDELGRRCHVVPLTDAFDPDDRRPRVAITFDDAYLGAVTAGIEEVARRGLPATIFVATGFPGGAAFWWDSLAGPEGVWPPEVRRHVLEQCRGIDIEVRAWASETGMRSQPTLPSHACAASVADLQSAVARTGITIGSHTVRHANLTRLPHDELQAELVDSRMSLERHFGSAAIRWLSYPYGLTSAEVMAASAEAGYVGAFRVAGGWAPRRPASTQGLPRLNIASGLSTVGFALRASGLLAQ